MITLKQLSYHLLMGIVALLSFACAGVIFFFGVGYLDLAGLLSVMFVVYVAMTMTATYGLNRLYRPSQRQVLVANLTLLSIATLTGLVVSRLLVGS